MDEAPSVGTVRAQESSSGEAGPAGAAPLRLLPPYLIVLLLAAGLSLWVGGLGSEAWREAQAAVQPGAEARRDLVFTLVFCGVVALSLVLAWSLEALAGIPRLLRGAGVSRVVGRFVIAGLPLVALLVGHRLLNPWLFEAGREAVRMLGLPAL